MKKKIFILIIIAITVGSYILELILPPIANAYNNNELVKMESIILRGLEIREDHIHSIESWVSGESYFMISNNTSPRLESCRYSMSIELNEKSNLNSDEISNLISDFNNKQNNQYEIYFREHNEYAANSSITISKRISIPLGNRKRTLSMNSDNTSTLAPNDLIYPLPFYDLRCRTIEMHNGA